MVEPPSKNNTELEDGLGDWRFHAVTRIVKPLPDEGPGKPATEAGAAIHVIRAMQGRDGTEFSFTDFSSVALSLNVAISAEARAQQLRASIEPVEIHARAGMYRSIAPENTSAFFDFIEQCMIAATFSYQALEAYCNFVIQDKLTATFPIEREFNGQKQIVQWRAEEIERKCSTELKLAEIVPKLLGMGSPKGKAVWASFKKLQRVRNDIIHLKYADQRGAAMYPNHVDSNSVFFRLVNGEIADLPRTAVEILNYFTKHPGTPRWLLYPLSVYGIPATQPKQTPGSMRIARLT
jgi:hypothetical protein